MKTKVTVVAFSDTQIVDLAKKKLLSIIPDNKELVEFEKDKTTYVLNSFDIKAGVSEVGVSFESKMTLKDDANIIDRNKIVSLTREQLEEYLSSFNEIAGFEIDFSPSFIQKVPNLVDRINIEIKK